MNGLTSLAIVLMIGGGLGLGLAYGGFSYTKETHTADVGALHLSVDEEQRVNIPMGVGIGALLLGGILLLAGRKR
jgi:TRAP-type C4-dicarboxylate transport system permease small subunit